MTVTDRIVAKTSPVRRAFAVLLVPIAVFVVWGLVFLPLRWIATSQDNWRADTRVELARARGQAQMLPVVQEKLTKLPSAPVWQRFYRIEGGADGGAAIQQDVANLCTAAGLGNQSITPLPSQEEGTLMKYGVRLSASGTADQLTAFVARMREHPRYLRAERLNVTAPQAQANEQNPVLSWTLDISGYAGGLSLLSTQKAT